MGKVPQSRYTKGLSIPANLLSIPSIPLLSNCIVVKQFANYYLDGSANSWVENSKKPRPLWISDRVILTLYICCPYHLCDKCELN